MRLFLILFFVLTGYLSFGQTAPPNQVFYGKLYEYKNGVRMDSAAFMPRRDTFSVDPTMLAPGMLLYDIGDSIMYYRNSFKWVPLFGGSPGNTIYTGDGTLNGDRVVDVGQHIFQILNTGQLTIDATDGANQSDLLLIPTTFQLLFNDGGPSSVINYDQSSKNYSISINTEALYNVNTQENAQVGQGYSIYTKYNPFGTYPQTIGLEQGFSGDSGIYKLYYNHTGNSTPVDILKIDSFGTVKMNKYKNNAAQDSVLSTDPFGYLKLKRLAVSNVSGLQDSLLSVRLQTMDSAILNRTFPTQTANFSISGNGAASRSVLFNAVSVPFAQYLNFSHSATDTTLKTWSFGVSGTPSGGPFHIGDSLTLRSYTNTGTPIRDAMVFYRNGTVRMPGTNSLILGNTGGVALQLTVNGIALHNGTSTFNGNMLQSGGLRHNTTTTITGDYTILSTDMFINVNNTANCTLTLPATPIGSVFYIKKTINNAFTVTIDVSGGGPTIDGAANVILSAFNASVMIHDDGSNYFIY